MIINDDCLNALKQLPENSVDSMVTDPPYGIAFMGKNWDDFSKDQNKPNSKKYSEDEKYKKNFIMDKEPKQRKNLKSWDDFEKGQEKREEMIKESVSETGNKYEKNGGVQGFEANHPIYKFEGMIEFFTPIWKEAYRVMKPGAFGFICCIPRQDCLSRMMISLEYAGFNINFTSLYWTYATGFPKALNIGKAVDKRLGREREVVGKKPNVCGYKDGWDHKLPLNSELAKKYAPMLENFEKAGQITAPASDEAKRLEGSYGGFQPKPAVEVIIVVMKPRSEPTYVDQALTNGKGVVWFDDCRIPYADSEDVDLDREFHQMDLSQGYVFKENQIEEKEGTVLQGNTAYKKDVLVKEYKPGGRFPANLLVSDDVLDDGFSRFFSLDAWAEKNVPFLIVPKASKREKNMGCEGLEDKERANCIDQMPNELNKYPTIKNNHPTVKPLKLMSYLITMGSRPGDVILDPFAGSGTTGCAAISLDRNFILIEKEEEYIEIIKARIDHFHKLQKQKLLKV